MKKESLVNTNREYNFTRGYFMSKLGSATVLLFFAIIVRAELPKEEVKTSYLDNGKIRLGVDLTLGGAVTFLAESKDGQNLINSHDWGRQVQMSFYSGPQPFEPNGKKPSEHWKQLGWNPIQSGDYAGKRSKVLEHRNNGRTIFVKWFPMQWPLDDEPGDWINVRALTHKKSL
ncbi:MAG: hypothetical protein O3C57_01025 [Verrucomicrobia bacterium]|nr:hypothetical protein [Verrucomicrobiota bacterium]